MSNGMVKIPNVDRMVWMQFVLRCQEEGQDVGKAFEAWVRRAIRQERSIMPEALDKERKVLKMRRE